MYPRLRAAAWREVCIETIGCPDGSQRSTAYVRLAGNSVATAVDCDVNHLSPTCLRCCPLPEDPTPMRRKASHASVRSPGLEDRDTDSSRLSPTRSRSVEDARTDGECTCGEACAPRDPTEWLTDPAFSVTYDPELHGVALRLDWARLVALARGTCVEGRRLTLHMDRTGLGVVVREHATGQKEVRASRTCLPSACDPCPRVYISTHTHTSSPPVSWHFLGTECVQMEMRMNEFKGPGQWHLSVPVAAVIGTWEVMRLAMQGREWMRAVVVAPPLSSGLVHMWIRSSDGRFRCLLSGDGEVRAGQSARAVRPP